MNVKSFVWPAATLLWVAVFGAQTATAQDSGVGRVSPRLIAGSNDVDTPAANAAVWINDCTGTLITPDVVVSAGHCALGQRATIRTPSGLPRPPVCADTEIPAQWYPLGGTVEIRVGNNRNNPRFRATATEYALPGCADIFAVRLADSVPAAHATPVKVLTRLGSGVGTDPAAFFQGQSFRAAGWGLNGSGVTPTIRQTATMQYVGKDREKMFVRGDGGAITASGDSGGPLFWQSSSGRTYLVGVLQGPTTSQNWNRYTPTFRNPVDGKPSVGYFFETVVPDAVTCDSVEERPEGTMALRSWWSPSRGDNFATTDAAWIGCTGARRSPDYNYSRIEGYVFDPALPQPPGTVRLYRWYDPTRGDNVTISHPVWQYWEGGGRQRSPNYTLSRLEGFVFDPAGDQPPGTVALYRWFSSSRGDNWTMAQFQEDGRNQNPLGPDYRFSRLVGYVYPARVQ